MGYDRYSRTGYGDRDDRDRDDFDRNYGARRDAGYYAGGPYGRNDERDGRDFGGRYREQSRDSGRFSAYRDDYRPNSDPYRADDRYGRYGSDRYDRGGAQGRRDYGQRPEGYDYQERGFFDRAGDEVRSWFGDNDAERRRQLDQQYDQHQRDEDYHSWRAGQIAALDRDYDEYRRENRTRFSNEFGAWRTERSGQRSSLERVAEHMEVVGSDGEHIGTVDKVRGDRIILTRNDVDAGGRHHSIPSRWIERVDDKVTVRKTAEEAKGHWRDEERNGAFFGEDTATATDDNADARILGRSFKGTY